jgi:transcriptional regulator with XRE-family HTH domain
MGNARTEYTASIGERIKKYLDDNPGEASRIAKELDISRQAINGWKRTGAISKKHLGGLSKVTGRSISYWMSGEEAPPESIADAPKNLAPLIEAWRWLMPDQRDEALKDIEAKALANKRAAQYFYPTISVREPSIANTLLSATPVSKARAAERLPPAPKKK